MSEEERGQDSFAPAEDTAGTGTGEAAGTDTADTAGIGADTAQAQKTPSSGLASLYDWVEMAAASLICVVLVFAFVFRLMGVDGSSMIQTLHHRDRVILWELFYTPKAGDIVVISRGNQEPIIKRVIGMPGDTISFDAENQQVSVNGAVLDEPYVYIDEYALGAVYTDGSMTVPDGAYFVMGDHRNNSMDSRDERVGLIDEKDIMGKAVLRLWPWEDFGLL